MKLSEISSWLGTRFPLAYQESYDNCGLLVGNPETEVTAALLSLDCTEEIIDEAISKNCNLIICHHPIIFKGLKKFTYSNYVERVVIKAIKNDIAIYAAHTNVDNLHNGVSERMCQKLGLSNCRVLAPKQNLLSKVYVYAPLAHVEDVKSALFQAGAGNISAYSECSFVSRGQGSFRPSVDANPKIGESGGKQEIVDEVKVEAIFPTHLGSKIEAAIAKLTYYEEKAYEIINLGNKSPQIGSGMIGTLNKPMPKADFLKFVAQTFDSKAVRYTDFAGNHIQKVAVCGGSGSFLLPAARGEGADAYISADFKYHEFFDAEGQIMICDIGHYESEQFTSEIFLEAIREKYPNFAVLLTGLNTNPIKYFAQ